MNNEEINDLLNFTIPQLLLWRVEISGDKVALREKDLGFWNEYTWRQYYNLVRKTAMGLRKMGLKKSDKIALIGDNIPEMLVVAIGAQSVGAISAGIGTARRRI